MFVNVHQLGLHIGAQRPITGQERRDPLAWEQSFSSTAAMTHLPDVVHALTGVSGLREKTIGRGGVGAPTDSYFNLNLCPPSCFAVIRLSLNMAIMWRAVCSGWGRAHSNVAALGRRGPGAAAVNYTAGFLWKWWVFGLALTRNLNS